MFNILGCTQKHVSSDKVLLIRALLLAVKYIDTNGNCAYCKYKSTAYCTNDSKNCEYGIFCGFMDKAKDEIKEGLCS